MTSWVRGLGCLKRITNVLSVMTIAVVRCGSSLARNGHLRNSGLIPAGRWLAVSLRTRISSFYRGGIWTKNTSRVLQIRPWATLKKLLGTSLATRNLKRKVRLIR